MRQTLRGVKTVLPGAKKDSRGVIGLALVALFVCQFAVICYFNLTQLRNHLGYDASWNLLRAALVWNEKTLISPAWSETTNLHLDTPMSLAALLYGITGNLLLSFGLADLAVVALLLFFVWKILDRLEVGFTARMIALNLVICPYMTTGFLPYNDLDYFSCLLSGAAYYSVRTLFVLMIIYEFLKCSREGKIGVLGWILWPVCLFSGFSFGVFLIVIVFVPYILYEMEMAALRDDWKRLIRKESVFAYVCCACVLAGKALAMRVVHFEAMDSSRGWTSVGDVWKNFGAVFQGFLKLLQVLPETVHTVMSLTGILRVTILVVFLLIVLSVLSAFRKTLRDPLEKNGALLFLVNLVGMNILVYGLFNVQYGASIFEERYLIPTYFVIILMVALFYDGLGGRRVLSAMLSLAMAVGLLAVDVHSDVNYLRDTNDEWQMDEIQALAEAQDAGIVYFWGDELTVIGRALRPCDLNRVYKALPDHGGWFIHWGDYTVCDDPAEYSGTTLLVCPREKQLVPDKILAEYTLLVELNQVTVYVSDHNPRLF